MSPILLALIWTFLGVRVSQDYDLQTAFTSYKTYKFEDVSNLKTETSVVTSPFLIKRIRQAVEKSLKEKGYSNANGGQPDFLIVYRWSTIERIEIDYSGDGWLGHRYPGDSPFETTVQQYDEGTITIDFIDAKSTNRFWRGTGTRRVNYSSSPQKSAEYIQKWVSKIIKQYPPDAKISKPASSGCTAGSLPASSTHRKT
jgi:hypothetical protein